MKALKRLAAKAPNWLREDVRKYYFRRQIYKNTFISNEPEYRILSDLIDEGDWVLDVGANIGYYTLKLSKLVGLRGRVIAFEPIPQTFAHLSNNVMAARCNNVTLINAAISSSIDLAWMEIPSFATGLKNFFQAAITDDIRSADTPVLTMPIDCLHIKNRIKFVKIDTEGHENFVFEGMKTLLERDRPTLIVESVSAKVRAQLLELGYEEKRLERSPNTFYQIPKLH